MRLVGFDAPFTKQHRDTLRELTPGQLATSSLTNVSDLDGNLYVAFEVRNQAGEEALRAASAMLWHGLSRSGFLSAEVNAGADSIRLIDPDRPVAETFPYLGHDVTQDIRDNLADYNIEPPKLSEMPDAAALAELEHMLA